jgi:hypothetical protein
VGSVSACPNLAYKSWRCLIKFINEPLDLDLRRWGCAYIKILPLTTIIKTLMCYSMPALGFLGLWHQNFIHGQYSLQHGHWLLTGRSCTNPQNWSSVPGHVLNRAFATYPVLTEQSVLPYMQEGDKHLQENGKYEVTWG